jgi:hypothetical protein
MAKCFLTLTTSIIVYILLVGGIVGIGSGALATPLRIKLDFKTDHLLDKISGQIVTTSARRIVRWSKIFFSELLLSHLLDNLICTTVAGACRHAWEATTP